MPAPSAYVSVNGTPVPNTGSPAGVNVTAGSVVTIALLNVAGVNRWDVNCTMSDGVNPHSAFSLVEATKVLNSTNFTCQFTMPAFNNIGSVSEPWNVGASLQFVSIINAGEYNQNTFTFGLYVIGTSTLRLVFDGENLETDAIYGVAPDINQVLVGRALGPAGLAGGDLLGYFPNPYINSITGWTVSSPGTPNTVTVKSNNLNWPSFGLLSGSNGLNINFGSNLFIGCTSAISGSVPNQITWQANGGGAGTVSFNSAPLTTLTINSGIGQSGSPPGNLNINSGSGALSGTSGGQLTITSGDGGNNNSFSTTTGTLTIQSGGSSGINTSSGGVTLQSGNVTGNNSNSGNITIQTGTVSGTSANTGGVTIQSGNALATGVASGPITLNTGSVVGGTGPGAINFNIAGATQLQILNGDIEFTPGTSLSPGVVNFFHSTYTWDTTTTFRLETPLTWNLAAPRHGFATVTMPSDADYALTSSQWNNTVLQINSSTTLTATRTITLPSTPRNSVNSQGAFYFIFNNTLGGQSLAVKDAFNNAHLIPNGQALAWFSNDTNYFDIGSPTGAAGGDLFGNYPNPSVGGLRNIPIESQTLGAPQDGYVLTFSFGNNWWYAAKPTGGGGGGGSVTWNDDLIGSTSTDQFVAAISGQSGGGGIVPLNITTLRWASGQSNPTINQLALSNTSSGSGSAGQNMAHTAQSGQGATGASHNGGAGGNLSLTAGAGGSSGSLSGGTGGNLNLTAGGGGGSGGVPGGNGGNLNISSGVGASGSVTGNSGNISLQLGGTELLNISGSTVGNLTFTNIAATVNITQAGQASAGIGANGNSFSITTQAGGASTNASTNGGNGANLNLTAGTGGAPGSGGVGGSGGLVNITGGAPNGAGDGGHVTLAGGGITSKINLNAGGTTGSISLQLGGTELINIPASTPGNVTFTNTAAVPTISQTANSLGNGNTFTIQAQGGTGVGHNGGTLALSSGSTGSGSTGNISLQLGGTELIQIQGGGLNLGNIFITNANAVPFITQSALSTASGAAINGQSFTITAQTGQATSSGFTNGGVGGALNFNSGTGGATTTSGNGGAGGAVNITAGPGGTTASGAGGGGGAVAILGGGGNNSTGSNTGGVGGNVSLTAGAAGNGGASGPGGNGGVASVVGGAGGVNASAGGGNGGNATMTGGTGGNIGGNGGNVVLTPGSPGGGSGVKGTIQFSGSQNVVVSSLKTANYTVAKGDYLIGIGTLSGAITITLPASPATGDIYIVKDVNGTCSTTNTVTVSPSSGNIDGQSSFVITTPYNAISCVYTGSQWSVI